MSPHLLRTRVVQFCLWHEDEHGEPPTYRTLRRSLAAKPGALACALTDLGASGVLGKAKDGKVGRVR